MDLSSIIILVFVVLTWVFVQRVRRRIKEIDDTVEKLAQERLIVLTVEVDNNQYFCYNAVTKAFVCQGYTIKEIIERFRLRYPNRAAAFYNGDETAVKTLKSQMKELNESFSSQ